MDKVESDYPTSTSDSSEEGSPGNPPRRGYNIWTNEDKKRTADAFVLLGTVKKTADYVGIPAKTIYGWVKQDWWPKLVEDAKRQHQELLEAHYSTTLEKAAEELADRLENGDIVPKFNNQTKEYEYIRVPVKAKELGYLVDKLSDKLRVMRNQPTRLTAEVKFDASKEIQKFASVAEQNRERIVSEQ